jgi:hypothetical protein
MIMMECDQLDLIPVAYHEAGHVAMTYWLGHALAGEGVWIAPVGSLVDGGAGRVVTRRCSAPSAKESVMILFAGHLAAHRWMVLTNGERRAREWQAAGGPGPLSKPDFLDAYLSGCEVVHANMEVREDWHQAALVVGGELDTTPDQCALNRLQARCARYQAETITQLEQPIVWRAVCKIAHGLLTRHKLSDAECRLTIGDDFAALEGGYHRAARGTR